MRILAAVALVAACVGCGKHEPKVTTIPIDGRPSAVALAEGKIWVADDEHHSVHSIDAKTNREVGRPIKVKKNPIGMTTDGRYVWVSHASGWVVRIDAETRRRRSVHADGSWTGIALFGRYVYVTDTEGAMFKVDRVTNHAGDAPWLVAGGVRAIAARGHLWVSTRFDSVMRLFNGGPKSTIVGEGPIGLAFDGRDVWTAASDDNVVTDVMTRRKVKTGKGPIGLSFTKNAMWVANQDDMTVSRFDRKTGKPLGAPLRLDCAPRGIISGGGSVWVACVNQEAVVRVEP